MNKDMGKAGIPASRKCRADKMMMEPPVSVLFVDNTRAGMLAKMLQKEEKRLGGITSYRVRIAESAGMALSRLLPSTNPWGPGDCGRQDCVVCNQQDEKQQDCRRWNNLYENQCQTCKVNVLKDGEESNILMKDGKELYIGESSRSLYERSKVHQKDKEDREDDSHQVKHWVLDHPDLLLWPAFKIH